MGLPNLSHGFSPRQCCSFTLVVIRRLLPGVQPVQTLLAFSGSSEILPVHVDAIRTTVDLGRPQLNQIQQGFFDLRGLMKIFFQAQHRLIYASRFLQIIDSRLHEYSSGFWILEWEAEFQFRNAPAAFPIRGQILTSAAEEAAREAGPPSLAAHPAV